MKLMLDTHILIWLAGRPAKLTVFERALLDADEHELLVSALSIFELRMKWGVAGSRRKDEDRLDPQDALRFLSLAGIAIAPIDGADFSTVLHPPLDHKDPFDEMLLVHAQRLGARLLTRDRRLADHPVALIA